MAEIDDDDVDYAPFPVGETKGKYDIAPKDEKGDDDGQGSDDHSNHSFDDDELLEEEHVKSF